jgi:hypothetical protein
VTSKSETTKPKKGISRRTVVKGTAWAVPAIVVAGPAPRASATPLPPITIGGTACKFPGNSGPIFKGIKFQLIITNPNPTNVNVTIDTLTLGTGESSTTITPNPVVTTPGTHSYTIVSGPFDTSANTTVTITYHYTDPDTGLVVNGTAGPTTVNLAPDQGPCNF